ncbi:hypothetical protein M9458_053173 [Cirrhinus mrigala]|uniref:Uncharacterized protein n=1 Tax=Cirrhinus mrigala TaxID=683832 RepID=A0ABD0MSH2_CIRMR
METISSFAALARKDLPFVEHAQEFCSLAEATVLDDDTINSLFWIGPHYHRPVDLPDTSGLSWREGILRDAQLSSLLANQHPEPSQSTPRLVEPEPKPTADGEPEPRATAQKIAMEPEPSPSDQVQELATWPAMVDVPVGHKGAEDSTAHCTATEGEQCWDLEHLDIELDLIDFSEDIYVEIPACPEQSACLDFLPTLPLLSSPIVPAASVPPPLSPDSPAAHPQPTICAVGSPRVCQSASALGLEDPSFPPPASESCTPPRPSDPAAPPRLSAPLSPPSHIGPLAPPGSIVPPAPPWLVIIPPTQFVIHAVLAHTRSVHKHVSDSAHTELIPLSRLPAFKMHTSASQKN